MSNETEFVEGLIAKAPRDGAPEYVKASVSIKREELIAWLQGREGEWVNAQIKEARSGKWYVAVDNWKPERQTQPRQERTQRGGGPTKPKPGTGPKGNDDPFPDDDIPFASNRGLW